MPTVNSSLLDSLTSSPLVRVKSLQYPSSMILVFISLLLRRRTKQKPYMKNNDYISNPKIKYNNVKYILKPSHNNIFSSFLINIIMYIIFLKLKTLTFLLIFNQLRYSFIGYSSKKSISVSLSD